jgi:hypothetical protein
MIRVIKIPVGSDPFVVEIDPTLEMMKELIGGGYIQIVPLDPSGLELCCDDEGKLKGFPPNFPIFGGLDIACGDVFLLRTADDGEPASVTPEDIQRVVTNWSGCL